MLHQCVSEGAIISKLMRFSLACERQQSRTVVSAMLSGVPHLCVIVRDGEEGVRGGGSGVGVVST